MNTILFILAVVLVLLSINTSYIFINNLENKCPKWMSWNWIFVLLLYGTLVGLGYFISFIYPYVVQFFNFLKELL